MLIWTVLDSMSFYISHLTSVLVELKFLKTPGTPFHIWNSSTISLFDLSFFHFYLGIPNNKYFSWSRMFHNKRMFVSHLLSLCLARLSGCYWNSRLKRPDQLPVWPYYFHSFLFPPVLFLSAFCDCKPQEGMRYVLQVSWTLCLEKQICDNTFTW